MKEVNRIGSRKAIADYLLCNRKHVLFAGHFKRFVTDSCSDLPTEPPLLTWSGSVPVVAVALCTSEKPLRGCTCIAGTNAGLMTLRAKKKKIDSIILSLNARPQNCISTIYSLAKHEINLFSYSSQFLCYAQQVYSTP